LQPSACGDRAPGNLELVAASGAQPRQGLLTTICGKSLAILADPRGNGRMAERYLTFAEKNFTTPFASPRGNASAHGNNRVRR
jgi:hypothetical protein